MQGQACSWPFTLSYKEILFSPDAFGEEFVIV
jgi:hypothetical protein